MHQRYFAYGDLAAILCAVMMTNCALPIALAEGQSKSVPTQGTPKTLMSDQRQEIPDMPYAPNQPPGVPMETAPPVIVQQGPFVSVQVNVDASGMNILGDAANEPSLAVDPTNPQRMAIGWRQFDTILSSFRQAGWGYSQNGGQSWTFPGVLHPGIFRSDPVLAADADGTFYFYSLTANYPFNTVFYCTMFRSYDAGVTWDSGTYAHGGDKQWFTVDTTSGPGRGNLYAYWTSGLSCCPSGQFTRSTDGGSNYDLPIPVPADPFWGTLSVGPDGALYMSSADLRVSKSTNAQNSGLTPTFTSSFASLSGSPGGFGGGPNPGGLLGQVWIATDHSGGPTHGNVYVFSAVNPFFAGDPHDVMFTRSVDGGQTWNPPVRVNDDPINNGAWQWFGTMSVAPNGRIDTVWNDSRNGGQPNLAQVFYSYSLDGGVSWSKNIALTPIWDSYVGWPQQNKIGDYYHMVSDNDGANLAYAATFNGEQDVYFLRITRDCNNNGIPDEQDLASGTSLDCNVNRYPDECEVDCNANTVPDDCDLAEGDSLDCNSNAVPDECDPDFDCNNNGTQDICDVASGLSVDCNANEVPDDCEIDSGAEPDCNSNGIPDSCDVVPPFASDSCGLAPAICPDAPYTGSTVGATSDGNASCGLSAGSPDKWLRYVPTAGGTVNVSLCGSSYDTVLSVHDACPGAGSMQLACNDDACGLQSVVSFTAVAGQTYWIRIAGFAGDTGAFTLTLTGPPCGGSVPDCNSNGVPDECDVAGGALDCNGNLVPDACDVASGLGEDCNLNGLLDECDILAGTSEDCDGNGRPDQCDTTAFIVRSSFLAPIITGSSHTYRFEQPPPAEGQVRIGVLAMADIDSSSESISVALSGLSAGVVFNEAGWLSCAADQEDSTFLTHLDFNSRTAIGYAEFNLFKSGTVTSTVCPTSFARIILDYPIEGDCNGNGTLDSCDIASGLSIDCNDNGRPDECEPFDCNGNGIPDECEPNLDCNGNGIQDICDVAGGAADCNSNGVPDTCEVDFDGDGTIDPCDACPVDVQNDRDGDGACDSSEQCPDDPDKQLPGHCGCGAPEVDSDADTVPDCHDLCADADDRIFAPQCAGAIPAVSTWGMTILVLSMLCLLKIAFGLRKAEG